MWWGVEKDLNRRRIVVGRCFRMLAAVRNLNAARKLYTVSESQYASQRSKILSHDRAAIVAWQDTVEDA